jgi:hypothetical protein
MRYQLWYIYIIISESVADVQINSSLYFKSEERKSLNLKFFINKLIGALSISLFSDSYTVLTNQSVTHFEPVSRLT